MFFTRREAILALAGGKRSRVVRMSFAGANAAALTGDRRLPGTANYLLGNRRSDWQTDVPTYRGVRYEDLYPGIDPVFYGNQRRLDTTSMSPPGPTLTGSPCASVAPGTVDHPARRPATGAGPEAGASSRRRRWPTSRSAASAVS